MKKNVAVSLFALALAMLSQTSTAQTALEYTVQIGEKSAKMTTTPGIEATWGNVTSQALVREVNSKFGAVENVVTNAETGTRLSVFPESVDAKGQVTTKFSYALLENGVEVMQGTHEVNLARGESVEFQGFGDHKDKVTLALAK